MLKDILLRVWKIVATLLIDKLLISMQICCNGL